MPSFGDVMRTVGGAIGKMQNDNINHVKSFLRKRSDQEIKNGLRNISSSDWRYQYFYEEARRRRLL